MNTNLRLALGCAIQMKHFISLEAQRCYLDDLNGEYDEALEKLAAALEAVEALENGIQDDMYAFDNGLNLRPKVVKVDFNRKEVR